MDKNSAEEKISHIRELLSSPNLDLIYKMDDIGLLYQSNPRKTMAFTRPEDQKVAKVQLSIVVCSNPTGLTSWACYLFGKLPSPVALKKSQPYS